MGRPFFVRVMRRWCGSRHRRRAGAASFEPAPQAIGTPACALKVRIVSEDLTLVTLGAEVSFVVRIR